MDLSLLDNIAWHALTGPQARFATGTGAARRYAPGFSPILAFADILHPDFAALDDYCAQGEHFYTAGWSGAAPTGWRVEQGSTMFQMVWERSPPADADTEDSLVPLGTVHVPQMLELVGLTHPGPFGPRTFELGDYFGCFVGERLVAMAGERMLAGRLREVSGVCTHPEFQGRGLAHRLVESLIRREMRRNETPFLHVMRDNVNAQRMYQRMGFRRWQEVPVRVVARSVT
jgi:ribosomal protein S18 acetylase RimI-like enzyme